MTIEQLEKAKELDIEIKRTKGMIVDLGNLTDDLRIHEHDLNIKSAVIRIEAGYEYKQAPPINLMSIIHFLEDYKSDYLTKKLEKLEKEFSEL